MYIVAKIEEFMKKKMGGVVWSVLFVQGKSTN